MFDNLVESRATKRRSWGQMATSVVVHGLVIFAVVKATQGAAEAIRAPVDDTTMVFTTMKQPEPEKASPKPASPPPSSAPMVANPPPKGFKTVSAPIDIPKDIPPIDFDQKPFDPKDFTGQGVEGGSSLGVVGGTGTVEGSGNGGAGGGAGNGVYAVGDLDDPVEQIVRPEPKYPPALRSAMISGRVEMQYVVDTTGHVEPSSVKVLSATSDAFVPPAKEAVLKGVFKAAKFRGRPVRQLVQQAISFKAIQ